MIIPHAGEKPAADSALPSRFDLGALCVMNSQPIPVDARRIRQLETLAAIVMDQLEVRLANRCAAAQSVIMAGEKTMSIAAILTSIAPG
jgi:hypothetical protein